MTIAEQLLQIRDTYAPWTQSHGGSAEVAADPAHLFAILGAKPGGVQVAILFVAEKKRGDHEEAGFVDRTFWIIITRGRGFGLEKADSLISDNAAGPPLYDLVEEARQTARIIEFDSGTTERYPDIKGVNPFQLDTARPVDAYQIELTIGTQLPSPDDMNIGKGFFSRLHGADAISIAAFDRDTTDWTTLKPPEIYDHSNSYDPSTGLYTVPTTGIYLMEVRVSFSGPGPEIESDLQLLIALRKYVGGVATLVIEESAPGPYMDVGGQTANLIHHARLDTGTTLGVQLWHQNDVEIGIGEAIWTAHRIA